MPIVIVKPDPANRIHTGFGTARVAEVAQIDVEASSAPSADDFQALEGKVLQAVEMIRREREALAAMEHERNEARAENAVLQERLLSLEEASSTAQTELVQYQQEREALRSRVERLLLTMDEILQDQGKGR